MTVCLDGVRLSNTLQGPVTEKADSSSRAASTTTLSGLLGKRTTTTSPRLTFPDLSKAAQRPPSVYSSFEGVGVVVERGSVRPVYTWRVIRSTTERPDPFLLLLLLTLHFPPPPSTPFQLQPHLIHLHPCAKT